MATEALFESGIGYLHPVGSLPRDDEGRLDPANLVAVVGEHGVQLGSVVDFPFDPDIFPEILGTLLASDVARNEEPYADTGEYDYRTNVRPLARGATAGLVAVGAVGIWEEVAAASTPAAVVYEVGPQAAVRGIADRCPTLKQGSAGACVRELQQKLGITADGIFGRVTKEAVRAFQAGCRNPSSPVKGLKVDGTANYTTLWFLDNKSACPSGKWERNRVEEPDYGSNVVDRTYGKEPRDPRRDLGPEVVNDIGDIVNGTVKAIGAGGRAAIDNGRRTLFN